MQSPINLHEKPLLMASGHNVHMNSDFFILPHHWSLHLYDYRASLRVGETKFDLHPGCVTLIPPNTPMEYRFCGLSSHLYAHFQLPEVSTESPSLPVFFEPLEELPHFAHEMSTMVKAFLINRDRAEIKLWDLLWDLKTYGEAAVRPQHPSLEKALTLIEQRLGQPIVVSTLAREVGLSRNHLMRLFRQDQGCTILAYIRQRRANRAKHLLEHTTVPMGRIADLVNIPNLQSFSTLVKKETGHSPSHWRRSP
ncbi:AraC family transcriptional regulator [bacterium]|nr:MAG: AraC family transcriptional regulator [bacterium]